MTVSDLLGRLVWQLCPATVVLAKLGEALNTAQPLLHDDYKNKEIAQWQRWRDLMIACYECA